MNNIKKFKSRYGTLIEIEDQLNKSIDSLDHPVYHPEKTLIKHIDIVIGRALERPEKELHFAAMLHDITKSGWCPALWSGRIGNSKTIESGTYWQNSNHHNQAEDFMSISNIKKWIISNGVDFDKCRLIVKNHMRMKYYISGQMKPKTSIKMKSELMEIWELLFYFSDYCDNMLKNQIDI